MVIVYSVVYFFAVIELAKNKREREREIQRERERSFMICITCTVTIMSWWFASMLAHFHFQALVNTTAYLKWKWT